MYGDSELALYLVQAQFLVALGLFNYIETLGAFRIGYFKKDNNGQKKFVSPSEGAADEIRYEKKSSIFLWRNIFGFVLHHHPILLSAPVHPMNYPCQTPPNCKVCFNLRSQRLKLN